ncbi:MAG: PAS domain S-box protein [Deltaproteobacteria bacterium]|jgi:PAS domain S-box-containing protein|nr:PAS domain S-box protein [Deltaproteobacteria bacterium]
MIRYILKIIKRVSKNLKNPTASEIKTVQKKKARSWGHNLREENSGLREKISVLRKETARLKKDLEKAWELMAHVPGGLFLLQQETIVYANKAACGWLGYSLEELSGKSLLDIFDQEDIQSIDAFIQGETGIRTPGALYFKNSEGRSVCCAVHINKTRYEGRNALLLNLIEIERKIEQEKSILEARKFEALKRAAGAFAREWEVSDKPGNPLSEMLNDYARKTYQPSEISPLNLNETIEASIAAYCSANGINYGQDNNPEDQILFKTSLNASSPIHGCRKDLHNAFMSLIANAVEALEAEGEIYLTADEKPGLINVYVQENGIGIHKNVVDNIFDPFFTTKGDGHKGLGLSLARAVIERHGGKIGVTRHEAGGATFHIKLPLDHSPFKTDDRPKKRSVKDARILLMGGQNILINLLCRFLSSKPLHITRVDSYGECFKALKGRPFHLMLVDQSENPEKTPWLIRKVYHTHPDLPIALFNASNGDDDELPKTPGADLVIPRPLHLGRFYSSIYRLMTEGKASRPHN